MLILILLLLAALTGVFWTVLKVTAIAVLSTILFFMVLAYVGVWYVRRRWNRLMKDPAFQQRVQQAQGGHHGGPGGGGVISAEGRKEPDQPLP